MTSHKGRWAADRSCRHSQHDADPAGPTIILFQDTSLVYVLSLSPISAGAASKIAQRDGRGEMYLFAALVIS
jgi:hypothetical protein